MRFSPFERRRRRAARVALYGSFTIVVAALFLALWLLERAAPRLEDQLWTETDWAALPEVDLLQRFIQVDTSPSGSEAAGARFLAEELRRLGLEPQVELLGEGHANVWAFVEGELPEALVLHNHVDVYPVWQPERWTHPPFSGEIDLPYIYGRGAFDMKSVTAAQLTAIARLLASGQRPRRSLLFLATGGEETGSDLGVRWILRQHPELIRRFWAVLTEGGIVEPVTREEIKYWGIENAQKLYATTWACASERSVLEALRREIALHHQSTLPPRLTPEVETLLAHYAPSREHPELRLLLEEPAATVADPALFRQLPPYMQAMFREQVSAFRVEDDATGGYRLRLSLQMLADSDPEEVRRTLLPNWLGHGVTLVHEAPLGSAAASPTDHPAFQGLADSIHESYPAARVGPYFLAGSATDSRFFRRAGIPSFGFSPFLIFTTDTYRVDQGNERIGLPGYVGGVDLYSRAVERLTN